MNDSFIKILDSLLWFFLLFYFCLSTVVGFAVGTYAMIKYFFNI